MKVILLENIKKTDIINLFHDLLKINPFIKYIDNDETLDFFSVQNSNYCKIKIFKHIILKNCLLGYKYNKYLFFLDYNTQIKIHLEILYNIYISLIKVF